MKKMLLLFLLVTSLSLATFASINIEPIDKKSNKKTEISTEPQNAQDNQKTTFILCTQVEVYLSCGGVWEGRFCTPGVLTSALWNSMADLVDLRECRTVQQ